MWPMVLRKIIQRVQAWVHWPWRLPRAVPSSDGSDETRSFLPEDTSGKSNPPPARPLEDQRSTSDGNAGVGGTSLPNSSDALSGPPKETEPPEGSVPNENPDSTEDKRQKKKPVSKGPREIGGRRSQPTPTQGSRPRRPPASRPELVCRKLPDSWQWEIVLSSDEECPIEKVRHNGESLDMVNGECRLPLFSDWLSIVFKNGDQDRFALFDNKPLIFKLRNNWTGDGRKVGGITTGHFVVIAPGKWERTGRVPVEPQGCTDTSFIAHYFFRDGCGSSEDVGGFLEYEIASTTSGFELTGGCVFDDSENGELFVGAVPNLKPLPNIAWVRVGEEDNGWKGENFKPDKRTLAEALNGRQGRFFIRVYDAEAKLLDSGEFRYLRNLKEIRVNGEPYTEHTILVPASTGHPPTKVRFIGVDGATVRPTLPLELTHVEARGDDLVVKPHPRGDDISCMLECTTGRVDVVLNLPRIWWRMERDGSESGEWCDTPLAMTRQEFREHARANATILLRLPRRVVSVRVGFDDELDRAHHRNNEGNDSLIPLADFVDYSQIDRRLNEDASFNVECGGTVLTLIKILADPAPTIISFTHEPETVSAGERVTLRWMTRNAEANGVVIDPEIGTVESSDSLEVALFKTRTYTLRLTASGTGDVTKTVTVTVRPPHQAGKKPIAHIRRASGGWKHGKGFSYGEIRTAGLTLADAKRRSMPIDKRRRSTHRANIETIGRSIEV